MEFQEKLLLRFTARRITTCPTPPTQGWTKVFIRPFGRWNRNLFLDEFQKFLRFWRQRNFRILENILKKIPENNCCKIYLFKKSPKKFPENCCKISFTLRVYVHIINDTKSEEDFMNRKNMVYQFTFESKAFTTLRAKLQCILDFRFKFLWLDRVQTHNKDLAIRFISYVPQ